MNNTWEWTRGNLQTRGGHNPKEKYNDITVGSLVVLEQEILHLPACTLASCCQSLTLELLHK